MKQKKIAFVISNEIGNCLEGYHIMKFLIFLERKKF